MTDKTLFEKIADHELPGYIVWEDKQYVAFLTPFANTPGQTIVVPRQNPGEYVFALDDDAIAGLMTAAKKVARLLEKACDDVERVALVFEGEAIPHVHAKLYPMHGLRADRSAFPKATMFFPSYPGYIMTSDGPEMPAEDLQALQAKIIAAHAEVSDEN